MRLEGRWLTGDDGVDRPVIDAHLILPDGRLAALALLIDTGADITVLAHHVAVQLAPFLQTVPFEGAATGVGGLAAMHALQVDLLLGTPAGSRVRLRGPVPVMDDPTSLDLSVIGRNALDAFDLIYSRPRGLIALLAPPTSFALLP